MFAATVSMNPFDVLLGIFIIVAGFNAGRFGDDYWVIPWMRKHVFKWAKHEVEFPSVGGNKAAHLPAPEQWASSW